MANDQPRHTPGPWTVTLAWSQQTGDTYSVKPYATEEQMAIDAKLIAAAPDLLAALKAIMVNANPDHLPGYGLPAREAIAKAEGK